MNFFFYNSQTVRNLPWPYINFLGSCLKMKLNQTSGKCAIRAIKMHQDIICQNPKEYLLTGVMVCDHRFDWPMVDNHQKLKN